MRTFAELLIEYTQRAGISDAELARTTGVQRQTIFRWKEGLVARPRYREDVIRIAAKLRLTAAERDEMLLAAGFPPEGASPALQDTAAAELVPAAVGADDAGAEPDAWPVVAVTPSAAPARPRLFPNPGALLGVAVATMLGVALLGGFVLPRFLPAPATPTPLVTTPEVMRPTATPIVAATGQKLLLVAPFVSYAADDLRFNVAGRVAETVRDEVQQARLRNVHVAVLETPVAAHEEARALLTQTGAAAVIWGEYDAGRVRANVTMRNDDADWVNPVDSPAQLALVVNDAVPNGGRVLAFYALGRVFREENEHATALKLFESALALNPSDRDMLASLHFYIGALLPVVEGQTVPVISRAIAAYTAAYALRPDWENIRYNRGTALLGRALLSLEEAADLDAAIADLSAVIDLLPRNSAPLINRGIAYYQRNDAGDAVAAAADFSAALALDADNPMSYYHRALALLRTDGDWETDMQTAATLAPDDPSIANGLCWGYSVSGQPDLALPACEAAVAVDPTGASLDGRAIAYAQLGRYAEAAADLEDYLGWVMRTYPDLYSKYRGPEIETWIARLRNGETPFDTTTLAALRRGE
jgi:tetratricopeptide (TPR) repeat protein/transcriptional regulator with XRE-family HTH domain